MSQKHVFNLPINPRYNIRAISWSDLIAIESNPQKWLDGVRLKSNVNMHFGTSVHAEIKHRKLKGIPIGNAPDKSYQAEISNGKIKFTIIGTPDDTDDDTIYEYKTSLKLWTKKQAENHGQLFTYALLKWKNTGKLPKKALLVSLETKHDEDSEGLVLTGKTNIHIIPITMLDVLKIQTRFIKAVIHLQKIQSSVD